MNLERVGDVGTVMRKLGKAAREERRQVAA
jgi:hypothetical protein